MEKGKKKKKRSHIFGGDKLERRIAKYN